MKVTENTETLEQLLDRWGQSRCEVVPVGGLLTRCPVAHKWKAPYRTMVLRETLFWRMHDLGIQVNVLDARGHILGARILLRSAIETLGLLVYLNNKMGAVVSGQVTFDDFQRITMTMMMGSRAGVTRTAAINILTVLKAADKRYPKLWDIYEELSESAHPNWEGVLFAYSASDPEKYETRFSNRWPELYSDSQNSLLKIVMDIFEVEYNEVWADAFDSLEKWIRTNDSWLQAKYGSSGRRMEAK